MGATPPPLVEGSRFEIVVRSQGPANVLVSGVSTTPFRERVSPSGHESVFRVEVEFYAGVLDLGIVGDGPPKTFELDVAPAQNKMGRDEYGQMLDELEQYAAGILWGLGAAHRGARTRAEVESPGLATFAFLARSWPSLEAALSRVTGSPHRVVLPIREERPLYRARKVDLGTLRSIQRRPSVATALRGHGTATATIDHPRRVETFDTPANRHLRHRLGSLARTLVRLQEGFVLVADGERNRESERLRAKVWASQCGEWRGRLKELVSRSFLRDLRPLGLEVGALQTICDNPAYQRLEHLIADALHPRLAPDESAIPLSLRPTFELYELWVAFKLKEALSKAFPAARWKGELEFVKGTLLRSIGGEQEMVAVLPDDSSIFMKYQPTFQSHRPDGKDAPQTSISAEFRPDFVLATRDQTGRLSRWFILDAKYRASRSSVEDALRDLHVYRDALRLDGTIAAGAFAICPNLTDEARRYSAPEYRQRHAFGVVLLRPGDAPDADAGLSRVTSLLTLEPPLPAPDASRRV